MYEVWTEGDPGSCDLVHATSPREAAIEYGRNLTLPNRVIVSYDGSSIWDVCRDGDKYVARQVCPHLVWTSPDPGVHECATCGKIKYSGHG